MRTLFLLTIVFIVCLAETAKGETVDSLLKVLDNTNDNGEQSLIYTRVAKYLQHKQIDSALFYAKIGFDFAQNSKHKNNSILAETAATLGDLYTTNNQLNIARDYYVIAIDYFKEAGYLFDATEVSMVLGNIYLSQGIYFKAYKNYQDCLEIALQENYSTITPHLYNNLGVLFLRLKNYEEASKYFHQAYDLFINQGDQYHIAHSMLNLASIREIEGEEEKAIKGYLDGIRLFMELKSWVNIAGTYDVIAAIYINKGDYLQAENYLNQALHILENNSNTFIGPSAIYRTSIYSHAARMALFSKDIPKSLSYARASFKLSLENSFQENIAQNSKLLSEIFELHKQSDSALFYYKSYVQYQDSLQKDAKLKELAQHKMEREFEKSLRNYELEKLAIKSEHLRTEYLYKGLILIILMSVAILILLFLNQKSKTAKAQLKKDKLEMEKNHLNQEIIYKNKELTTKMIYLIEKNEFIASIARKLDGIRKYVKRDEKLRIMVQQIINELKQNISSKTWDEFEIRFMEVHEEFYQSLNETYPGLTPNEKKLCAFLRLNMTSKEISAITHQSVKSINTARFRLRKKMQIPRDENLISFLANL